MFHGPCRRDQCLDSNGYCSKHFPKPQSRSPCAPHGLPTIPPRTRVWLLKAASRLSPHLLLQQNDFVRRMRWVLPAAGHPEAFTVMDKLSSEAQQELALQATLCLLLVQTGRSRGCASPNLPCTLQTPKLSPFTNIIRTMREQRGMTSQGTQTQSWMQNCVACG